MLSEINPKLLKQAMKRMGLKQEDIPASEVIIKTPNKNLIIKNPQVAKINAMGQESIQIIGKIEEEFSEEDIKTVIQQTNCSEKEAKSALEKSGGDLAKAILLLKSQ